MGERALEACKAGRPEDLEGLDPGGGGWPGLKDDRGATGVHYAARSGNLPVLQWLVVSQGCPGNTRSRVGATPALDAAATGQTAALTWLLDNGGSAFTDEDHSGATALHLAARYGHLGTVKWLETSFEAEFDVTTKAGATPLHFAASHGDLDVVKFLVEKNPTVVDRQMETGVTAAYLSAQEGHLEALRYLVEEGGAKVSVTAFDGMTCLHAASQKGRLDCVAWLVVTGKIGINEFDFDGATALHFAAGRGYVRVVEWLLLHGASITQDNLGGSPLHDAAEHGQVKCVRALLRFGCPPGLKDNNGMTAADLAENGWHRDCAATLRRRLAKGVNGQLINSRKRPSVRSYFSPDYMDMSGVNRGSDNEGAGNSDYVDVDSGSETSSTYVVHTDMSRSSAWSSDGDYWQYFGRFHGNGNAFPHFSIPPPPSSPPPPIPNPENGDITSSTSSLSEGQDYENLTKGELASIMQMRAAIRQGGVAGWNGGMPIYGIGGKTGHEKPQNGDAIYGHAQMNGGTYGNPIYSHGILKNRPAQGRDHNGVATPTLNGAPPTRPVLARYQATSPVNHDSEGGVYSRVTMSPRLMEILERDSEVGSREGSLDVLESNPSSPNKTGPLSPRAPPTDLPIMMEATPKKAASSAPCTPAHPIPPAPPPPPPATFTPPTNSLRWKKMAFGSLPNVNMTGDAARFLLRPAVREGGNKKPSVDLIAELKAANGRASLKRVKRQENEVDDSISEVGAGGDSDAESEPKAFWKQLQKRSTSPHSDAGSRRSSVQLRPEFDPQNFVDKVGEKDALGTLIPGWKKLILARQIAEKEQAADDQRKKEEEEQGKFKNVPAWKRALIEKKEKEAREKKKREEEEEEAKKKKQKEEEEAKNKNSTKDGSKPTENGIKPGLRKMRNVVENLDIKNSKTEEAQMAPWQLELKKKRKTFKDGFV